MSHCKPPAQGTSAEGEFLERRDMLSIAMPGDTPVPRLSLAEARTSAAWKVKVKSMYVCMYAWMDGWMDRWMDGWMDGWMDVCMYVICALQIPTLYT